MSTEQRSAGILSGMSRINPIVVIVGGGFWRMGGGQRDPPRAPLHGLIPDDRHQSSYLNRFLPGSDLFLSPAQIGAPLRVILRNQPNTSVFLGRVTGVNPDEKQFGEWARDRENVRVAYEY